MLKPLTKAERDALYATVPWLDDYTPAIGGAPIGGWRPFKRARAFVRSLKFKNNKVWRKYCKSDKRPDDIPTNPDKGYKGVGWVNWGDWFGTDSIGTKPFEQWVNEYKAFLTKSKICHHSSHATWATNMRKKHKKGLLSPEQIKTMESIPDWKWASKEERRVKSLREKVVELEHMVKKNPKLAVADLKRLGRNDILLGRSRHPEAFAHIKLGRHWTPYEELVPIIQKMVRKNGGTLPSYAAIKEKYGEAMATRVVGAKRKRPNLFKGIKQDSLLKSDEQYREILVVLQKEHGFIPHGSGLIRLGHSGLVDRIRKNPSLLRGLSQRKVSNGQPKHERTLNHWLKKYPVYLKQRGGRPGYAWLVKHNAEKLYHMRRTYPKPFEALERGYK